MKYLAFPLKLTNLFRFMELMTRLNRLVDAYQYLEEMAGKVNFAFLRVLYLERTYEKGIDKARAVYKR